MKIILAILLMLCIIVQALALDISIQAKPGVAQLSGADSAIFEQIRGGADLKAFNFSWNNPKMPRVNITDENIEKDLYTDPAYSYLINWSSIIPPLPKA